MQVQAVESRAQNPDLPLDRLGSIDFALRRQEQNLSFAGSGRRLGSKDNWTVNELLVDSIR